MIDIQKIASHRLQRQPFAWAEIDHLYSAADAQALARTYPCDHFKTVEGYGGEKDYHYEARALVVLGADSVSYAEHLSPAWQQLAQDLLSPGYRMAISELTGCDVREMPMEANVYHYGPGSMLGPHRDLPEKRVVHVLYFNDRWNPVDGGCLAILNSGDANDVAATVSPIVGNSAVLVRSDNSWHEVTKVSEQCRTSRRSVTVTFYTPGSVSPMWAGDDTGLLHTYSPPQNETR